ncbi:DUF1573 domain-containing protein [Fulvivirga sediminis]|nr:DUF1573 domain-containing protein [Fulvivirga sediminis]
MMKSRILLLVIMSWVSMHGFAQQEEEMVFSEKTFDFGTIKEEDGAAVHQFSFINKGLQPIKISSVKASCGCTTPDWTKEEVKPGETGFIQARYDTHNRPGSFNKSLTVMLEGQPAPVRLYIRGNVTPLRESMEEDLPTSMGKLRVKYRSFNMGKVLTSEEPTTKKFDVYNSGSEPIVFEKEYVAPEFIKLKFNPQVLLPKESGEIEIIYEGKTNNNLGFNSDNVTFYTDEDGDDATKSISVYATVMEYFPPLSQEDLAEAPRLKISSPVHDFGKIKQGEKVTTSFQLYNSGKTELKIREAKSNCSCAEASVKKDNLKPGESTEVKITFNSNGRRGNQQKSVTIFSNDPTASAQRVTVKAYVEAEGEFK